MKIDYSKINWNASTYWEFCGTPKNLRTVWDRYRKSLSVWTPIEEFAYWKPRGGPVFAEGDIVTYRAPGKEPRYATVIDNNCGKGGLCIRLANGDHVWVHPGSIQSCIAIADIPDELIALARADAIKPIDFSNCSLRNSICTEANKA